MSKAGILSVTDGMLPPSVPTSFVENTGTAVPAVNILNIIGGSSFVNNTNGIFTSGAGNTVTINLSNRVQGTVTTADATPTTLISQSLVTAGGPGAFAIEAQVVGFDPTGLGVAFSLYGAFRTDGATATLIDVSDSIVNADAALVSANALFLVSGNSVIVQVTGVAGHTIRWNAVSTYTLAT